MLSVGIPKLRVLSLRQFFQTLIAKARDLRLRLCNIWQEMLRFCLAQRLQERPFVWAYHTRKTQTKLINEIMGLGTANTSGCDCKHHHKVPQMEVKRRSPSRIEFSSENK